MELILNVGNSHIQNTPNKVYRFTRTEPTEVPEALGRELLKEYVPRQDPEGASIEPVAKFAIYKKPAKPVAKAEQAETEETALEEQNPDDDAEPKPRPSRSRSSKAKDSKPTDPPSQTQPPVTAPEQTA